MTDHYGVLEPLISAYFYLFKGNSFFFNFWIMLNDLFYSTKISIGSLMIQFYDQPVL